MIGRARKVLAAVLSAGVLIAMTVSVAATASPLKVHNAVSEKIG